MEGEGTWRWNIFFVKSNEKYVALNLLSQLEIVTVFLKSA